MTTPNVSSPAKATFDHTSRTRKSVCIADQHFSAKSHTNQLPFVSSQAKMLSCRGVGD